MTENDSLSRLYLRDESSGRWHQALVEGDKEPQLFDACNVEGAREYFHTMPAGVDASLLCARCFG